MPRMFALVVCLGSFGWGPSAAMAQSADLAALVAHVQALEATITAQAAQIAALQTVTGTAISSSLNNDHAWVFETESETDINTSLAQYDDASGVQTNRAPGPHTRRRQNDGAGGYRPQSGSEVLTNTWLGVDALINANAGAYNTAIGANALGAANNTGVTNTAIGADAMTDNTTGSSNSALGVGALGANTTGSENTASGFSVLMSNSTGSDNVAIGAQAMNYNSSGDFNTAIGTWSLWENVSGDNNTALGVEAGNDALGSGNVFLGYQAGYTETGSDTLYIANSDTSSPLIYGEFDTGELTINGNVTVTGTLTSTSSNENSHAHDNAGSDDSGNTALITTNTTNIATNKTNIATHTTNISTNTGLIAGNTTAMTTNQAAIQTNSAALGVHTTQIAGNVANITTNASGIAGAMAMAQLSEAGPGEKLVISLGGGAWEGRTAMAAGLSGRINDKFSLRGSASLGNGNAGVSASVGWRLK